MSLPYYFEVPEIELPFDVMDYVDANANQEASSKGQYLWMMGYDHNSKNTKDGSALSEETGMSEQQNAEMSKLLREWAKDTFTIRTTSVSFLRTLPGQNGWWHCEGPAFRGRRCALNFLVEGDVQNTKAEWGYCKLWGDVPAEQVEHKGFIKPEYLPEMEVYDDGTYQSDVLNRGFFYNTMYLHRGVNENSKMHRTILSIAVQENLDIQAVYKVYQEGKLFR